MGMQFWRLSGSIASSTDWNIPFPSPTGGIQVDDHLVVWYSSDSLESPDKPGDFPTPFFQTPDLDSIGLGAHIGHWLNTDTLVKKVVTPSLYSGGFDIGWVQFLDDIPNNPVAISGIFVSMVVRGASFFTGSQLGVIGASEGHLKWPQTTLGNQLDQAFFAFATRTHRDGILGPGSGFDPGLALAEIGTTDIDTDWTLIESGSTDIDWFLLEQLNVSDSREYTGFSKQVYETSTPTSYDSWQSALLFYNTTAADPCHGDDPDELGRINKHEVDEAWWLGDNCYETPIGNAENGVANGSLFIVGGTTSQATFETNVVTDPTLPFLLGDPWSLFGRFRLIGPTTWDSSSPLSFVRVGPANNSIFLEYGSSGRGPGIAMSDGTFAPKSFATGVWWQFRLNLDSVGDELIVRARAWLDSEEEPEGVWDVTWTSDDSNEFNIEAELQNTTGAQRFELDFLFAERNYGIITTVRNGYIPAFKRMLDDPVTDIENKIAILEAGAMAIDWHTKGGIDIWGGDLIPWAGRSEGEIILGAILDDVDNAWIHFGQNLRVRTGTPWDSVREAFIEGRAVVIAGDVSALSSQYQHGAVEVGHGMVILPHRRDEEVLVGNPHHIGYELVPESEIQSYAEAFGLAELGMSTPQLLVWGQTKAWVTGSSGDFTWPVDGTVTQEYGCTGFYTNGSRGGCTNFHDGIDIAAPLGTPVVAPGPGKISLRGFVSDGAFNVQIDHDNGVVGLLGHLREEYNVVSVGQRVSRGQTVAHIGLTGNTTGPHTHWELRRSGVDFDPREITTGNP